MIEALKMDEEAEASRTMSRDPQIVDSGLDDTEFEEDGLESKHENVSPLFGDEVKGNTAGTSTADQAIVPY